MDNHIFFRGTILHLPLQTPGENKRWHQRSEGEKQQPNPIIPVAIPVSLSFSLDIPSICHCLYHYTTPQGAKATRPSPHPHHPLQNLAPCIQTTRLSHPSRVPSGGVAFFLSSFLFLKRTGMMGDVASAFLLKDELISSIRCCSYPGY